jgi:hypothetical protein
VNLKNFIRSVLDAVIGSETSDFLETRIFYAVSFGSAFTTLALFVIYLLVKPTADLLVLLGTAALVLSAIYLLARSRKMRPGVLTSLYVAALVAFLCADWALFGFQNGYCLYMIIVYGAIFPVLLRGPGLAAGLLVLAGIVAAMFATDWSRFDGRLLIPDPRWFVTDRFLGAAFFFSALTIVISIVMRSYRKSRQRIAALNESLIRANVDLEHKNDNLENAMKELKILKGIIPICGRCKKIRDPRGVWNNLERYLQNHSDASFTHGLCPDCLKEEEKKAGLG